MNKKERKLALATALQSAAGDMIVCEDFGALEVVSTKGLLANLAAMGVQEVRRLPLLLLECSGCCGQCCYCCQRCCCWHSAFPPLPLHPVRPRFWLLPLRWCALARTLPALAVLRPCVFSHTVNIIRHTLFRTATQRSAPPSNNSSLPIVPSHRRERRCC